MRFKCLLFFFFFPILALARPGYYEPWGKDADLSQFSSEAPAPKVTPKLPVLVRMAEKVILFHQNVLSPVDGPRSHFRPTSSRYMLLAMRKHGFIRGFILGCDRLLRENGDDWVYRTIEIDGTVYKYDPVP